MRGLVFMHDELGVRIVALARGHVGQTRRVIGMHVSQNHGFDLRGIDRRRPDVGHDLSGGRLEVVARSRFHQRKPTRGVDQECVDGCAARGAKGLGQNAASILSADVPHRLDRPIDKAVADGGDNDIADAPVIDARDLLLRCFDHELSAESLSEYSLDFRGRVRFCPGL